MNQASYLKKAVLKTERITELLGKKSRRLALLRLSIALTGVVVAVLALYFQSDWLSLITLLLFLFTFTIAAKMHQVVKDSILKFNSWKQIKEQQLQRLNLDWEALPKSEITLPAIHPFAKDLDICGYFSLHRLLDNCISRQGSQLLLDWLSQFPENIISVLDRQEAVRELAPLYHFRDKLALISGTTSDSVLDAEKLLDWLKAHQKKIPVFILPILSVLALLNLMLGGFFFFFQTPAYWIFSLTVYIGLFFVFLRHIQQLFSETMHLESTLKNTTAVLHYLEGFRFSSRKNLEQILKPIQNVQTRPARFLRQLNGLMILVGLRQNPVIGIIVNLVLPADFILMYLLQNYKRRLENRLPQWLESLHQLDALSALANFAWLHPQHTYPEFHSSVTELQVQGLVHPLIPKEVAIRNDFSLNEHQKLTLITGSNMSGKSTFLRTIGANLALAYSGSVVCAEHFSTSLFRIHSCIRVNDALDQGLSYFYAEVKRLRLILDAINDNETLPVFFLIDEIFKGTNNRERLSGSRAYILSLLKSNALGLISSHDLELTALADQAQQLKNFHFEEQIRNGKMTFDYKIKPGPSPSTNALKIMELEGLPIGQ